MSTTAINETLLWKGRREQTGYATWMTSACPSRAEIKNSISHHEARAAASSRARVGGERRTREWLQTQLHEARAQGLKHADYTKSRESLGGHCIGPRVISCQIDLSFVFDPGTASELEKKNCFILYIFQKELHFVFWRETSKQIVRLSLTKA